MKLPQFLLWGVLISLGFITWQQNWLAHVGEFIRGRTGGEIGAVQVCRPVQVADGDTFTCLTAQRATFKVRLRYVDAPERGQPYARAAQQALKAAVWNQTVHLHSAGQDRYGRHIAEAYVNGRNINQHMVRSGYAWAYRQYLSPSQRVLYLQLEQEARHARRGLWVDAHPTYPPDYRRISSGVSA